MKVICISDTHNKHEEIPIPDGDVLIHAGDITEGGTKREVIDFLKWFSAQSHQYKIFIAGNHDFYFEKNSEEDINEIIPENVHYLKDSEIIINDIKFWGSPVTPGDGTWAFNQKQAQEINKHWEQIPDDTKVLITHTPPYKIKDVLNNGRHIGCGSLTQTLQNREIGYHIFGHVHDSYGITTVAGTKFINASCLDNQYRYLHQPLEFRLN
ncbi:metallophosphatase domain-containing protein [Salegentibacter sp. JZCK2]|uniref:metallophosphatase domain-containing protein n=1 Tax=Salegentibacter tibetensis TaxID=2873600 RepID=UPI001CCB0F75|nr:metallophosphatase domain-containing protein [Salegentibacter tibetensis]MBZ9729583.1 metallophosphatase domain-containing protein [Salegentibacter tibetensis]